MWEIRIVLPEDLVVSNTNGPRHQTVGAMLAKILTSVWPPDEQKPPFIWLSVAMPLNDIDDVQFIS